ncbi:GlxA family transcriptional regulator [Nocardia crassostreae]|uniref:GlxA family transcriptional regulator n=1 Tax=Nocardia crassostreae TaxID=53428 RepID=UPI00082E3651|nr:helix-turn-helix domain-containing protein [Nocardia crassostreae]
MHVIAILALDAVVPFELTIPGQVFGTANTLTPAPAYEIRLVAPGRKILADPSLGGFTLRTEWDLPDLVAADTIVIPGHANFAAPQPEPVLAALRAPAARGTRIASVCVGAFTLAATGLLDGRRATTHWRHADELAQRYPSVEVDPAVLFIDDGQLLTSAGVAAGLDLCLHLVRRDLGAAVAAYTARGIVMPLQREGGQAQFIHHPVPGRPDNPLQHTLAWMEANLHRSLTLTDIARHASLSVRTLTRHFQDQVGTTPLQWLLSTRVRYAHELLETTDLPIETIARQAGFATSTTLRHHFTHRLGASPKQYRASFHAC